tara:strand:- start:89 stop:325 length:237 start_codon:yes stop_codon:yes gene_type:complete
MLSKFFEKGAKTLLGRWNNNITSKQKEINFMLSNLDHCGDSICGKPKPINDILNTTKINDYNTSFTSKYLVNYKFKKN